MLLSNQAILSWVHCVLIVTWVALQPVSIAYTFMGLNSNENRYFHLADILGRSVLLHTVEQPSLAVFAQQSTAWRTNGFVEGWMEHSAQSRVCHQRVQSPEQSLFCSQSIGYIITRAPPTITTGSSSFILKVLEIVWHCSDICGMCTALWVTVSCVFANIRRYCM